MILEQEELGDWWWDIKKGTRRAACIATQHFLWVQPEGLMLLGVRLADWCEFHPPPHCHHAPSGLPAGQGNPSSQRVQNGPFAEFWGTRDSHSEVANPLEGLCSRRSAWSLQRMSNELWGWFRNWTHFNGGNFGWSGREREAMATKTGRAALPKTVKEGNWTE